MNILEYLGTISGLEDAKLGQQPPTPDGCIVLAEYPANPPLHSFGRMDVSHNVQLRARDTTAAAAYARAAAAAAILNNYRDHVIGCQQITSILDIGVDDHNPPRHEYTVNFIIRRY